MPILYTIGYTQKTLARFVELLEQAQVDAILDIRLRNTSQLAGFAKRDDLAFLLDRCLGIAYEHHPELAPTPEILDDYKHGGDWAAYERAFLSLLAKRDAQATGQELMARYRRPCLLCAEPTAAQCHRRLVAEWWARYLPGVAVVHLI